MLNEIQKDWDKSFALSWTLSFCCFISDADLSYEVRLMIDTTLGFLWLQFQKVQFKNSNLKN